MSEISIQENQTIWSPLSHRIFRDIWIASVVSNIGSCMQDMSAAPWAMASFPHIKPIWVTSMITAGSLPLFVLGLPAGAIADFIDKRRLLLITQAWMMVMAGILGVMDYMHLLTPLSLLVLAFSMGIGGALNAPAWQAITTELVPRKDIMSAVTLNGAGFNISRALGPALGGFIVGKSGPWAVFTLNAVSFLAVLVVLYKWKRVHEESILPTERMMGAIHTGLRYVRYSPSLQATFIWTTGFVICTSSLWALMPVLVKNELNLTAQSLGNLWTFLGVGAILGAIIIPYFRKRFSIKSQMTGAMALLSGNILFLGLVKNFPLLCADMFITGIAWLAFMTTINSLVQLNVSEWVRARALSVYLIVFAGSMALGSAIWGLVATHTTIPLAYQLSSVSILGVLLFLRQYHLPSTQEGGDLSPSAHWPEPVVVHEPDLDDGPVLVTVEYKIKPENKKEFVTSIHELGIMRRRDGSLQWGLYHDVAEPERFLETFIVESWAEHLRQHDRVTNEYKDVEEKVEAFHIGENPPKVSHMIYAHFQPDKE